MLDMLHLFSGVALILFGVRFLRKGLDRLFGVQIDRLMQHLATSPRHAVLTGVGMGMGIPSSTSIAVLLLGPLQSGQLNAKQIFPLILGANVGLTILVFLASLPLEQAMPVMLFLGVLLFQFVRHVYIRGFGQTLMGLGFVFMGVLTIKQIGQVLGLNSDLVSLIHIAENYPVPMTVLAAVLAVLLQSSTASILLLLSLGTSGVLRMEMVLPVVIGANLGVEVTRLFVGWQVDQACRVATVLILCKLLIAVGISLIYQPCVSWLNELTIPFALLVAVIHTSYNLLVVVPGIIASPMLFKLLNFIVPVSTDRKQEFDVRYIRSSMLESPNLALGQSLREILRAAELVREMLDDVWWALKTSDIELAQDVSKRDDQVDFLDREIKQFLTQIASNDLDPQNAREQMFQLRLMSETESIGDIVDKNLSELVIKKIRGKMTFSPEGSNDLDEMFNKVRENIVIAETAFQTRDRKLATQLLRHKEWLSEFHRRMEDQHLSRLNAGLLESHQTSAVHLDLLANLKRINSCVCHVVYAILLTTTTHEVEAAKVLPVQMPKAKLKPSI